MGSEVYTTWKTLIKKKEYTILNTKLVTKVDRRNITGTHCYTRKTNND